MIKMKTYLLGAIAGDMIGSPYESRRWRIKTTEFPLFQRFSRFTDDTVLTVATMDCLLHGGKDYAAFYKKYARKYPDAGFGKQFKGWMYADNSLPYNSWGNGSAMRVSPVGWAFGTLDETLAAARASAEVTHNHPEGIRGAEAVAACIFLARNGKTKDEIREYVENTFGYDLRRTCREIRPTYRFDSSCQGSVPEAMLPRLCAGGHHLFPREPGLRGVRPTGRLARRRLGHAGGHRRRDSGSLLPGRAGGNREGDTSSPAG